MSLEELVRQRLNSDGLSRLFGIRVTQISPGSARAEMELREGLTNLFGSAHGGAIFSLADQAGAAACNSLGRPAVAMHMSIHYLRAPRMGDRLIAEAKVVHKGSRMGLGQIFVRDSAGELIARSDQTFYILDRDLEEMLGA